MTLRIHRLEVLLALGVVLFVALAGIYMLLRLTGVDVPDGCFDQEGLPACRIPLESFFAVRNEASLLLGTGVGLVPLGVGLVLGVPIVASEVEMRTLPLAWSFAGSRPRWLVHRLVPMLAIAVVALALMAVLETNLLHASRPARFSPELDHLGSQGPTFVARGIMALGVGLLVGAVVGRTLPAFVAAGVLCLALVFVGATGLRSVMAQHYAVWSDVDILTDQSGPSFLQLEERYRDQAGRILGWDEVEQLRAAHQPDPDQWVEENLILMRRVVPDDAFVRFEQAETAAALGIGALGIVLTVPVLARRRPA